jgi:hypothetical protein
VQNSCGREELLYYKIDVLTAKTLRHLCLVLLSPVTEALVPNPVPPTPIIMVWLSHTSFSYKFGFCCCSPSNAAVAIG